MLLRYGATGAISFVGTTLLLRLVGPEVWAPYAIGYFLATFAEKEIGNRVLGALITSPNSPSRALLETSARVALWIGVVMLGALLLAGSQATRSASIDALGWCLAAAGVSACVLSLRLVPIVLLERRLAYGPIALLEVVDHCTFFAIVVPLVSADPDPRWLALGLAVRGLPSAVAVRLAVRAPLAGRLHRTELRRAMSFALPGLGGALLVLVDGLTPIVVLSADAHELGLMIAAASIAGYPAVVHIVAQRVSFPAFAQLAGETEGLRRAVARSIDAVLLAMVTMLVPVVGLAPLWLQPLLGDNWDGAATVVLLISIGFLCNAVTSVIGSALYTLGAPSSALRALSVATGLYVLSAPLVGLSATRVAIVYAISRAVGVVAMLTVAARHDLEVPHAVSFVLAAAAAVATALSLATSEGDWVVATAVGLVGGSCWLLWVRHHAPLVRTLIFSRPASADPATHDNPLYSAS